MALVWDNFVSTTLSQDITPATTTINVEFGTGAQFPYLRAGDYSILVLEDDSANKEVVHLVDRVDDVLTVVRAQEGTSAAAFSTGDRIELRVTGGFLTNFVDGGTF
jgi:hypothetical protein